MSEAVSSAAGAATQATTTSGAGATSGGNQAATSAPQTQASASQSESRAPAEAQGQTQAERILSEQDLDAYIEQKINGKVERVKVRDALKGYGLEKTANQRLQEAAQIKRQTQELVQSLKSGDDRAFEFLGIDKAQWLRERLSTHKDIAEEVLAAEYERMQMSPEQREALELKAELERYKTQELTQKKPLIEEIKKIVPEHLLPKGLENATAEQLNQFLQVKQQEFQAGIDNLSNELLGAWEQAGLPKQKEFGQWMAQVMSDYQKRTGEYLQPAEAAARVKSRFLDSTRALLSQMDAKAIQETLGEEIVKKLRAYDVERVTQSGPQFGDQTRDQANQAVSEPKKQMNQFEFRKWAGLTT